MFGGDTVEGLLAEPDVAAPGRPGLVVELGLQLRRG